MSGLFKSLKKELDSAGKSISKDLDNLGKKASHVSQGYASSPILDLFKSGNVVQLISRSSGKALQVVVSPTGQLVVDGCGPEGPQFQHAHWTVLQEGNNIIRLYNQNNYIGIVNGAVQIMALTGPATQAVETKLRVAQIQTFVTLESFKETGHHVGVLNTGALKSALATGREIDAQFGVRLIYSPYPPPPAGAVKK